MNGLNDWFQNNWIDLARLLVQCAILAAIMRYGRRLLATLRASQEQVGALLKLSVADSVEGRPAAAPAASEPEKEYARPASSIAEPAREHERSRTNIWEAERDPEPAPEREPEPVFAGAGSRGGYGSERQQSLGGRVIGSQAHAFATSAVTGPARTTPPSANPAFAAPPQRADSPSLTPWVSAPVSAPVAEPLRLSQEAPPIPRATASTWLQAPMRNSGASPWRKMVRWLQAPAGH
jgi:hypothetical protein